MNAILGNERIKTVYIYMLFTLIVLTSGSLIDEQFGGKTLTLLLVVLSLLVVVKVYSKKIALTVLPILAAYMIIEVLANYTYSVNFAQYIIKFIVVFSIILYCNREKIDYFNILGKIILVIACTALIFYFLINIFQIPLPHKVVTFPRYTTYNNYFNLYFAGQDINWYGRIFHRNHSIFWEAGVFQIYLNFALIVYLFKKDILYWPAIVIIISNIILTFSTTGLTLCIFICLFKLYEFIRNKEYSTYIEKKVNEIKIFKDKKKLKYTIGGIISVIIIILIVYIFKQKMKFGTMSLSLRMYDFLLGLKLFASKPIYGWGYGNNDIFINQPLMVLYGRGGNSNGIISLMYQMGLMGLVPYAIALYNIIKNKIVNIYFSIALVVFFVACTMSEPLIYSNFILVIISIGLANLVEKNNVITKI